MRSLPALIYVAVSSLVRFLIREVENETREVFLRIGPEGDAVRRSIIRYTVDERLAPLLRWRAFAPWYRRYEDREIPELVALASEGARDPAFS